MINKIRIIAVGITWALMPFYCDYAYAAQVTFNLSSPGTYNNININTNIITDLIGTISDSETTSATGYFVANLNSSVDLGTHQISAPDISFLEQTPGNISLSPMTFSLKKTILFVTVLDETIQSSTLRATPKTPSPPTTLTPGSGNFTFPMSSTQLVLNQGTIDASGTTAYHQDCGATPITTSMQTGDGTLTFNKTADTIAKVVYSINLKVPVSFSKDITTGTVSIPVIGGINYTVNMTGSGTMDANTGSVTQTFASAYWDTSTDSGLQAGNGTWSAANAFWSNTNGNPGTANALYAWTADAAGLNANFSVNGASAIAVSGGVSANSLNIGGTGYTFSGGAIAVGSGGITAAQSTSISSNITLGANQIWSAALTKTLTVGGNISGGTYALTVKGGGTTALGGTNSLNSLKVGDAAGVGSLTVAGGATAVGNSFDLASGTVNLNGGTLAVGGVSHSVGTALATFNFNGGTLQATAAKSNFMAGLSNAYVREGGAKIDTQNFDISIGQALAHAGSAATDGGLLKTGSGKLTLTGAISYTGTTTIAGGALAIDNHQTTTLGAISGAGNLYIGSGSTLNAKSIDVNTLSIGSTGAAAAVPEPASMILLAIAGILGGFAFTHSRRK